MAKCIFEECIPAEVNYVSIEKAEDGKTLAKAAGMWKQDQKITQ